MARPLREGTLGEPPAPLPSPTACGGGGGAAPTHGHPPRGAPRETPTRLSCGDPPAGPPDFGLYSWGPHGEFPPPDGEATDPSEGTPRIGEGSVPNGHPPGRAPAPAPPGPEQELGARLRRLGDSFQRSHEAQRRGGGVFWGPLFRWVAPWLELRAGGAPLAAGEGN